MPAAADFLAAAVRIALASVESGRGGPFGAVVVREGEIVGRGANEVTSALDPTAHAEIVAIRAACRVQNTFDLSGCVLYASCEPCPMCLGAMYWARLERVVFAATRDDAARVGFDDAHIYREFALPIGARTLPMTHVTAHDEFALAPFAAWTDRRAKVPY